MCVIVLINRGEKEIESVKEFKNHFGFFPENLAKISDDEMDACLCNFDLDETFKNNKIEYKTDAGDYFVGQLELVKGDND